MVETPRLHHPAAPSHDHHDLEERRHALRQVAIFQHFTDAECDLTLAVMKLRHLRTGDVLFRRGEAGDTMVVVQEGRLRAEIDDGKGHRVEVGAIGPGEVVGEMALLDPAPRTVDVIAACDGVVFELSRDGAMRLRREQPAAFSALVGEIITDVTKRLRSINQRVERELNGDKPKPGETGTYAAVRSDTKTGTHAVVRPDTKPQQPAISESSNFLTKFWSKLMRS